MRKVWIRKKELGITLVAFTILVLATFAIAVPSDFQVKPFRFDPNRTDLGGAMGGWSGLPNGSNIRSLWRATLLIRTRPAQPATPKT